VIDETTVRLDPGEILEADLIIYATGFIEQIPFLYKPFSEILGEATTKPTSNEGIDIVVLFLLDLPNTVARQWIYSEVQSQWTFDYFLGRIKLPNTEKEMYEEIEKLDSRIFWDL
jgi:hypothetical protein